MEFCRLISYLPLMPPRKEQKKKGQGRHATLVVIKTDSLLNFAQICSSSMDCSHQASGKLKADNFERSLTNIIATTWF